MCILLLSHSFIFFRLYFLSCIYGCIPVYFSRLCTFIITSTYSYFMFMYLHRASWHSSATLNEVYPCFFLSCKANARVNPTKMGHGPHSSKIFVLFYVLFILCCSMYCLFCVVLCIVYFVSFYVFFVCKCVLYCCHRVATQLHLINISYHMMVE